MTAYSKTGYLHDHFRIFHPIDGRPREFSFHYHDFNKILILLQGDVTYHVEGRVYDLAPNDIVLVKAGEVHRPVVRGGTAYDRIVLYISPDFLRGLQRDGADLNLCFEEAHAKNSHVLRLHSFSESRLSQCLFSLDRSVKDEDFAADLLRETLFLTFMVELNRSVIHRDASYLRSPNPDSRILSVLDYIAGHLSEPLSIDRIANEFFVSRYYLMHAFRDATGYTISSYIEAKRLTLARERILSGQPITKVCFDCGYQNYSTFSRAFKKKYGESPRAMAEAKTPDQQTSFLYGKIRENML